jgi:peptide/nickel transport system substrate-binding protein
MRHLALGLGLLLAAAMPVAAQPTELRVAVHAEASSIDPNYAVQTHNATISLHVFDALVRRTLDGRLEPGLATAWEAPDPTTWIFRLRPGVRFHDGTPLTAADVAGTIHRIGWLPSPALRFTFYTNKIERAEAVDDTTVRFVMKEPDPILPFKLSFVFIVKDACRDTATEAFVRTCMIGTGAYRFVEQRPGESIRVARNDAHWAGAPGFGAIAFRVIPSAASRTAALLAGDIDLNSRHDPNDIERIRRNECCAVQTAGEDRNIAFAFNLRERVEAVTDREGRPLARNPFTDPRVRQALSLAVNREAIVNRILEGVGTAEGQPFPSDFPGSSPRLRPPAQDQLAARRLLAEAGFPNGFRTKFLCSSGFYTKDRDICIAVAGMLAQVGVQAEVEAMPPNVFVAERGKGTFGIVLWSGGTGQGEILNTAMWALHTADAARGFGAGNWSGYSNPRVDALLHRASQTFDNDARYAITAEAVDAFMADVPMITINRQLMVTATRRPLGYTQRADGMFNALHVTRN